MTEMIPAFVEGVLTPVEKLDVHRRGLRHLAISVFVLRGHEVLLQQRAAGKYHTPGLWTNTCCTHPKWGEDPLDCARRRLREELGITGLSPWLRDKVEYRAEVGNGLVEHEVVDIILAEATPALQVVPDPEKSARRAGSTSMIWMPSCAAGRTGSRPGCRSTWRSIVSRYSACWAGR